MNLKTNLIAALAAAALAAGAGPASAAITASAVTSPADGTTIAFDGTGQLGTVTGTTVGSGNLDLRCAYDNGSGWSYRTLGNGANIAPAGDGSFSVPNVTVPSSVYLCRVVAVPTGTSPADPAPFTGPKLHLLAVSPNLYNKSGSGINNSKQYDFGASMEGPVADAFVDQVADGGLDSTYLLSGAPGELGQVMSTSDVIEDTDPATEGDPDTTRPGILVDTHTSFMGYTWNAQPPSLDLVISAYTPFPAVSDTATSAADGSLVLTEHDVVVQCTGSDPDKYPVAGGFACNGLKDAGVAIDITTTFSPSGTVVERRWKITSTDAQPHVVKLVLGDAAGINGSPRTFELPGETAYASHAGNDVITPPSAAPWTVRFHTEGAADGDAGQGVGAMAFGNVPSSAKFTNARSFIQYHTLNVPATGDVQLRSFFMSEATQSALEADIATAEAALRGTPLPPPGGGTTPPPPPGGGTGPTAASAPRIVKQGKAKLKGSKLALGYALDCPGAGPGCSAAVTIVPKAKKAKKAANRKRVKPLAKGTVKAAAGKRKALVLKVSKKNRAKLRHGRFTLTIRLRRATLANTKLTKTVKLR